MSLVRFAENAIMTLQDWRGRTASPEQRSLGDRLRAELKALAESPPAGPQLDFWRAACLDLSACADTQDPLAFMRWEPVAATMAFGTTKMGLDCYRLLRRSPRWPTVWSKALRHRQYGAPRPFLRNPWSNAITVQHASHLEMYQQRTGQDFLDADCIVDLGAGYGSMCALARRLGFRGQYVIFDQPPVLALQRYYLGLNGIDADYAAGDVSLCRSMQEVMKISSPFKKVSLLSTWALSEMPIELRQEAEPMIWSASKVMLAYQEKFEGISNRQYFDEMANRITRGWQHFEIDFYPTNYYVISA